MARVYALNESHNCDYGVDFINGVASVPDADTTLLAWFTNNGYTVVSGSDTLSAWDYLTKDELTTFAPYMGIDVADKTKQELVTAIETALITLMKIEITEFDAIASIDGGAAGEADYANAAAVIAVLPESVEVTFSGDIKATVPVTTWVDTDTYDPATAASYTFTATLGDIPLPFANTADVTATVEVVISE